MGIIDNLQVWDLRRIIDKRPNDYLYALMSNNVYIVDQLQIGHSLPDHEDWKIHKIKKGRSEYLGAIYVNDKEKHIALAHRGTDSIRALIEDFRGIFLNKISPQKKEAFELVKEAVGLAQ